MNVIRNIQTLLSKNETVRMLLYRLAMRFLVVPYIDNLNKPIIAITGTNGKTTVTKLLDRIYTNAGYCVGTCSTSGVYHNGVLISKGDESGGGGVWKAAHCPNVDILILETARKGIIDYGIGFKKCNVGIVTNIYEDHLGYDGISTLEEMAELKSIVIKRTKKEGTIVLNGDDPLVVGMGEKSQAKKIYFMVENNNYSSHTVFFLNKNMVCKKIGSSIEQIIDVNDIPITINGKLIYNVMNVMAVLAAVEGMNNFLPINDEIVKKSLSEYGSNLSDNVGRFLIGTLYGENFIFCNSKNPEGFSRDIQFINKIKKEIGCEQVIGILSGVGNRNKQHYEAISKIVAQACELIYLYPPKKEYLRGRSPESIVMRLSSNIPKNKIKMPETFSLSKIIASSNKNLKGKKIFIIFNSKLLLNMNFEQLEIEGKFVNGRLK